MYIGDKPACLSPPAAVPGHARPFVVTACSNQNHYRYEDLTMGGSSQPKNTTTTTIT